MKLFISKFITYWLKDILLSPKLKFDFELLVGEQTGLEQPIDASLLLFEGLRRFKCVWVPFPNWEKERIYSLIWLFTFGTLLLF